MLIFHNSDKAVLKSDLEEQTNASLSNQNYVFTGFNQENLSYEDILKGQITKAARLIIIPSFFSLNASTITYLIIALTTRYV